MKISVVIPTRSYKHPDTVEKLANDLGIEGLDVVVCHDFTDSESMLSKIVKDRNARNVFMPEWSGYSKTCNRGAKEVDGDIILFLNSDLELLAPIKDEIIKKFEADPRLGVLGAKLYFPNGTIQHAGCWLNWTEGKHFGRDQEDGPQYEQPFYCPWITGTVFAVRRECWNECGPFDERLFFMCEDDVFCFDAWEKGWKVLFDPKLKFTHQEGGARNEFNPMDKEFFRIGATKGLQLFTEEAWKRPLNEIYRKVWEANKELHPETEMMNLLILERTGALGDVILLTSVLESLSKNYPETAILVRTKSPQVFKGNQYAYAAGENVSHALARVVTLNMAHENRPILNIPQAMCEELGAQGIKAEVGKVEIYSTEYDWHGLLARYGEKLNKPYAVIHPGATHWKNRNLPNIFWMEVIHHIKRMGLLPVIVGVKDPLPEIGKILDLRNKTTLQELHQLIVHAKVFVGPDSTPIHVAEATETPIVGIYTSINPEGWIIRPEKTAAVGPSKGCRYCRQKQKPPLRNLECPENKDYECTKNVEAGDVIKAVKEILK